MPQVVASHAATALSGIIYAYLVPRMAEDQVLDPKRDLRRILAPMKGGKTYGQVKGQIADQIREVTRDRLAQDADITDVAAMLDAIEAVVGAPTAGVPTGLGAANGEMQVPDQTPPMPAAPPPAGPAMTPPNSPPVQPVPDAGNGDLMAQIRDFIANHVAPEVLAQFDQLVGQAAPTAPPPVAAPEAAAPPGDPEPPADPGEEPDDAPPADPEAAEPDDDDDTESAPPPAEPDDDEPAKDSAGLPRPGGAMDSKNYVTKVAMDAAIQKAIGDTQARMRAVQTALEAVRPRVGRLTMAFDSASDVYKHALTAMGVAGIDQITDPAAFKIIFDSQPRPAARGGTTVPVMASDGGVIPEGTPAFNQRFKNVGRVAVMS